MPVILDPELYKIAKDYADIIYKKPSAYKSGFIVNIYKSLGGRYGEDKAPKKLKRWFKEKWVSLGGEDDYPVYRPTKRISKETPLTVNEIDPTQIPSQVALKQVIKGDANLPPWKKK